MDADYWAPSGFFIATTIGPLTVQGYVWRGLGLHNSGWGAPRTKTKWTLTHLGSGALLGKFTGDVSAVFPIAAKIAQCGDFTLFDLPDGWQQTDPALREKVAEIMAAHPEVLSWGQKGAKITDDNARAVIAAREGADA